ncbi:hypothetical protein C0993_002216 [Termitomyces sp. T159_Od127]|nr:hypothetical protein C0993_002216 [Termitomyces sp. T159_Od127]
MVPFDVTTVVIRGDEIPEELNTSEIALGAAFYHNGVAHSFFSRPVPMGQDGKGCISIEEVLVRLNTTYTPNGTFALKSDESIPGAQGNPTWISYDAAICVELFEPWIVEVYNSTTGLPQTLRIVQRGSMARSQDTPEFQEKLVGLPLSVTNPDAHQTLNSSKLANVELTAPYFAQSRGLADVGNLLPYFAGNGEILTRRYQDLVLSSTYVNRIYMGIYIGLILLLGVLAGFFVPKLPLNVAHRDFEAYSLVAAFYADELVEIGGTTGNVEKNLDLHEIVHQVGDIRFRLITSLHGYGQFGADFTLNDHIENVSIINCRVA